MEELTLEQKQAEQKVRESATKEPFIKKFEKAPVEKAEPAKLKADDNEVYFDPTAGEEKPKAEEGKKGKEEAPKLNLSRFKPFLDKDPESEDEIETAWKKDREELSNARVLAQGRKALDEDKEYQSQIWWANKADDETLVKESISYQYQQNGTSKEEADKKAAERLAKQKELNPYWLEDTANNIRGGLKQGISARENEITESIKKASEGISFIQPSDKLDTQVREELNKIEDFLGMKIRKEDKEKLMKEADIPTSELVEKLKDPATLAKVKYFLKFEKQLKASVLSRTDGKAKILDKLPKTPSIGTGFTNRNIKETEKNGQRPKFSPASYNTGS